MEDEIKTPENPEVDYIETINQLKQNTVAKDQYNKLKEENQRLLKSIINGEEIDVTEHVGVDVNQLRKDLYSLDAPEMTNLEFWEKTLALRNAIIESGADDPFLPKGHQITPTVKDYEVAERVAGTVQECIDRANGDPIAFTSYLQQRMTTTAIDKLKK